MLASSADPLSALPRPWSEPVSRTPPPPWLRRSARPTTQHADLAPSRTSPTFDRPMPARRQDAHPGLFRRLGGGIEAGRGAGQRLTRLLINVTVQRSLGPVHVVVPPESTVAELIRAALEAYAREGRRAMLPDTDPGAFDLHYSQFSLESLSREEKLMNLGSRNFFLCHKPRAAAGDCRADEAKESSSTLLLSLSRFIYTSLRL